MRIKGAFCLGARRVLNNWRSIIIHNKRDSPVQTLHGHTQLTRVCNVIAYQRINHTHQNNKMWAQHDGRPAEYRWRPLFNDAKFGWRPILECRAVTLRRRKTRWNLQGCRKLPDRSQPLVGRSSPCGDMWRRYCCLTSFFSDCQYVPYLRRYSPTKLCNWVQMAIF